MEKDQVKALKKEVRILRIALRESLELQTHYAKLMNQRDNMDRILFSDVNEWLERLRDLGRLPR